MLLSFKIQAIEDRSQVIKRKRNNKMMAKFHLFLNKKSSGKMASQMSKLIKRDRKSLIMNSMTKSTI